MHAPPQSAPSTILPTRRTPGMPRGACCALPAFAPALTLAPRGAAAAAAAAAVATRPHGAACGSARRQRRRVQPRWSMMARYEPRKELNAPTGAGGGGSGDGDNGDNRIDGVGDVFRAVEGGRGAEKKGNGTGAGAGAGAATSTTPAAGKKRGTDKRGARGERAALPTLSSLSGLQNDGDEEKLRDEKVMKALREREALRNMGIGMSPEQELNIVQFLKDVYVEFGLVEWPSVGRVLRLTAIVLLTIIIASGGIYVVDSFFYWITQRLFETDI
jgi:preprotein translocase SecE subunit